MLLHSSARRQGEQPGDVVSEVQERRPLPEPQVIVRQDRGNRRHHHLVPALSSLLGLLIGRHSFVWRSDSEFRRFLFR